MRRPFPWDVYKRRPNHDSGLRSDARACDFSGPVGAYNIDAVSGVDLTAASLDSNSINATALGTFDTLNIFVSAWTNIA